MEKKYSILKNNWCLFLLLVSFASFAQITQRGTATTNTATTNTITVNKPAGVVQNDVMIVVIAKQGNTANPSSAGWTLIDGKDLNGQTDRNGAVLYKVAGASEPVSYTFSLGNGTSNVAATIIAFSGVDVSGATPFDVAPTAISIQGSQTGVNATARTTVSPNAAIIMCGMAVGSNRSWNNWSTATSPGVLTEIADVVQGNNNDGASVGASWAIKAVPGNTGAGSATLSSSERNGGILIALKPIACPVISSSNAGPDQANAGVTSFTLAANTPTVGTGAWTIVNGPNTNLNQLSSTTNPTATFTPATPGTYVLRWTISNSCDSSVDEVVITNNCVTNMITNGDFSGGSTGWTFAGIPGSDRVEVNTENTYFSNSNPSLTAELDSEASLRQVITVIPGVSYTVGFRYARRPTSGTPATTGVTVRVTGGAPTTSTGFTTTSTTPQVGSFTFIPTTTTVGLEFYNHLSGGITLGTIIDDIVLLPASQANPYAVTNPRGDLNTTIACAGVPVQLDVENAPASGATYLWTGTAGAVFSSTTIKTPTVTFSGSGLKQATVTVTSASGCAVTSTTYVNVTAAPVITAPGATVICSGTYTSGPITSTGTTYDWSRAGVTGINNGVAATGGSNIANTGFTETLTNSTNAPVNVTYVLTPRWSTNSCAGIPYNLVVTVNPSTAISSQSTATQTVCLNAAFSPITVTATGVGLTYQWYRNTTASTTGGISLGSANGAQTNSYTPQSTTAGTLYYYVVVSGTCGNVTSAISGAFVTNPLTAISSQSTAGQIRCLNTAFSPITVTATGVGLTYQWYSNTSSSTTGGTSLGAANGAQTNSYTPQSTTVGTLYYYVVVSGTCGNVTSGVSGAFVTNPLTAISSQSTAGQIRCLNAAFSPITVTATGVGLTYQWYSNTSSSTTGGTSLGAANGAQTNSYTPQSTTAGTLYYYVVVSGTCGIATSVVSGAFVTNVTSTPTATVSAQPNCSVMTGSITLSNLPSSGTIFQTVNSVTTSFPVSQVGGEQIITGLAAGSYTFAVSNGTCTSGSTTAVVINNPPVIATWDGTNWSSTPTTTTRVVFSASYSSGSTTNAIANVDACSCYVNSNAVVIFNSGHTLNVINEVVVQTGTLTFENNASLVQVNENPNINSGNIIYKRVTDPVNRYDYTYWSSPVTSMTLGLLSPQTFFDKYFSYNNAWVLETRATPMVKGKGYIVRAPQTTAISGNPQPYPATFTGVPHNGQFTLSGLAASQAHLLGNPYPSAIDAKLFLDLNSNLSVPENQRVLVGTLYFWTNNTPPSLAIPGDKNYNYTANDYATYNRTGGTATAITHPLNYSTGTNFNIPNGKIAAGQGFFAPTRAGGNVVFNNTMRIVGGGVNGVNGGSGTNNSQFFKLSANSKTTTNDKTESNRIWLNLTNTEGAFKQTLIGYVTGATNDYEGAFDGITYDGNAFIDFYSVNNEMNLSIQGRALPFVKKDSVALGYKSTIVGDFQISIDQTDGVLTNQNVLLEDKDLKILHDLKKEAYTFNTQKGTFNNRFILRYVDKNAIDVVPEIPEDLNAGVIVSVKNAKVTVNSPVEIIESVIIYNIAGRKLYQKNKVMDKNLVVQNMLSSHQVLVVKITLENGKAVTSKIIY